MGWRATVHFYGQLKSVLKSGMPIDRGLELAGEHSPAPYRAWSRTWADGCRAGQPLGDQMRDAGERAFPAAVITAGERSGRTVELCDEITDFYHNAVQIRDLVIGRAVYPLVLLHCCLMIPVLPLWIHGAVPGWTILAGPAALWTLALAGWLTFLATRAGGLAARLGTRRPLRFLVRPLVAALTCRVLHAAAAAGMLWPDGLRLAAESCGNRIYAERLRRCAERIESGELPDLTSALVAADLPREVVDLIAAAEHAGETEDALHRAATFQQERFRSRVEWTARVTMGTFYGIAIAIAAITIITMFYQFYVAPARDLLSEF